MSSSSSDKNRGEKRQRDHSRASYRQQQRGTGDGGGRGDRGGGRSKNPRRGGPGMLLTCEAGREGKCRREGLDILRHYLYASQADAEEEGGRGSMTKDAKGEGSKNDGSGTPPAGGERRELSLEEEIAMLKSGASADDILRNFDGAAGGSCRGGKGKNPFELYDTGCKGTIFVMCTLPNCNLIPAPLPDAADGDQAKSQSKERISSTQDQLDVSDADKSGNPSKKRKVEGREKENKAEGVPDPPPWDPIDTVRRIMDDLSHPNASSNGDAPESRFVTRMIPIQATCFASLEEIRATARPLLDRYLLHDIVANGKKKATFEIAFKRRNCAHLKRDGVIEAVAKVVGELREAAVVGSSANGDDQETAHAIPELSVDLSKPDYTIQIEVCKTLCGMSVVPRSRSFRKFNLFEVRQQKRGIDDIYSSAPTLS